MMMDILLYPCLPVLNVLFYPCARRVSSCAPIPTFPRTRGKELNTLFFLQVRGEGANCPISHAFKGKVLFPPSLRYVSSCSLPRLRGRAGVGANRVGASPLFQNPQNHLQNRLCFLEHLIVPEPQYPESLCLNLLIPARIIVCLFLMLPTIQFDNQLCFQAGKIGDIDTDGDLAPESVALKLSISQRVPKVTLGIRRLISQRARPVLDYDVSHIFLSLSPCPHPNLPP